MTPLRPTIRCAVTWAATAAAALAFFGCSGDQAAPDRGAALNDEEQAAPSGGEARPSEEVAVECPRGDLVLTSDAYVSERPSESPQSTPKEALDASVGRLYPGLPARQFEEKNVAETPKQEGIGEATQILARETDGEEQAIAEVEKQGESWTVTHFQACNSVLKRAKKEKNR